MDTSFWTALNPNIERLKTKKVMHKHHLYRLAIHAPGSSLLRHKDGDLRTLADIRNQRRMNYNFGGAWRQQPITDSNIELLELIKQHMPADDSTDIKVRVEEPNVQFYSQNDIILRNLAMTLRFGDNTHFSSIMGPEKTEHVRFLLDGFTLRKREVEWPYRIIMRDGKYSSEVKTQIHNYLTALGDVVKVPRNLSEQLTKGGWIWGGYIYTHDPNIRTMLAMIDPRIIAKLEEFKTCADDEINTTIISGAQNGTGN